MHLCNNPLCLNINRTLIKIMFSKIKTLVEEQFWGHWGSASGSHLCQAGTPPMSCYNPGSFATNFNSIVGKAAGLSSWTHTLWWFESECHQRVALFGKIRRIRRCGLVGGCVSLGVGYEVSKAYARPRVSPSAYRCCEALSYCFSACQHAAMLPDMRKMD